jgi:hypothetical protein
MGAGLFNFPIECGSNTSTTLTLSNRDGTPLNLTGWTFRAQVRDKRDDSLLFEPQVTITNPLAGQLVMLVPGSMTKGMPSVSGKYDLLGIDPAGVPTRIIQGDAPISAAVTRI